MNLRPARMEDEVFLYRLRHDEAYAAASFGPPPDQNKHRAWLQDVLLDKAGERVWIIEDAGNLLGCVRVSVTREVSIALTAEHRGKGHGTEAIRRVLDLWRQWNGPTAFKARIKPENAASRRAFAKAGFVETEVVMEYRPNG